MSNPVRIKSKDVPKIAYKLCKKSDLGTGLISPYFFQYLEKYKFNKSDEYKQPHSTILNCNHNVHVGRISVFATLDGALKHRDNMKARDIECWKVETKQTTKYAYMGFIGLMHRKQTYAVDQVKPIERMV